MDNYNKLLEFWNESAKNLPVSKIEGKRVQEGSFNEIINEFLQDNSTVLDFGCGTGWGIFELAYTKNISKGYGVDPSNNAISYALEVAKISNLNNISFICGDESSIDSLSTKFDFIFCVNTIDVLPDEIIEKILLSFYKNIDEKGYIFIGINPNFPIDFLINQLGMQINGNYCYKNSILRANLKSVEEWRIVFSKYFNVIRTFEFCLISREKQYPRRGFILKKK